MKAECLRILRERFDNNMHTFTSNNDGEILQDIRNSVVCPNDDSFRITHKLCMPFIRFKKDEEIALGVQALDLKLPFGEIEVLEKNLDLIKRQIGLEEVEVLSVNDPDALAKVGSVVRLIHHNPPFLGKLIAIFLTR